MGVTKLKTEEILNEREKTHGDFRTAAETHYKAKALFRPTMEKNGVPLYRIEAIEAIIAKINRIVHGNHDHDDHWDDIAGYAKLGRGQAKEAPCKECALSIEFLGVPCDKHVKVRCDELNKMKESENSTSSKMEHVGENEKCSKCNGMAWGDDFGVCGECYHQSSSDKTSPDKGLPICPKCTEEIGGESLRTQL